MISALIEKIKKTDAPVVVGLDPMLSHIPECVKKKSYGKFGESMSGAADAVFEFNRRLIDCLCDIIPAVKPQIAMYEQLGTEGVIAFKKTVDYAHSRGLIVIGDVKRGDIGSTSEAYAAGHLGRVKVGHFEYAGFDEDFATVNPYLGTDGIAPFIDACNDFDKGIFILVKTSNKSSGEFQDRISDGRPIYEHVAEKVNEWSKLSMDGCYSNIGAVCGATYPQMGAALRRLMPGSYILVPGYGAQGATAKDLKPFFNDDGLGAIINSSRGIIAAYKQERYAAFGEENFADAARAAALDMIDDIRKEVF